MVKNSNGYRTLLRNIGNYSRRHGMSVSPNKIAQAKNLYFGVERIHVLLSDGREISAPLEWFPRLRKATDEQRQQWELIGGGVGSPFTSSEALRAGAPSSSHASMGARSVLPSPMRLWNHQTRAEMMWAAITPIERRCGTELRAGYRALIQCELATP